MKLDLERATAFVETQGSALDRARVHVITGTVQLMEVPDELRALQNADGGFPVGLVVGRPSALSPTAHALSWLRDLQLVERAEAQRALAFIAARQMPRGIWRERLDVQPFNPPPWMDPESTAADVYTTALCAGTIAVLSDDDLPVDLAVNWLQTQQGPDGLLIGFKAHSSWLAVPAFERINGQEGRATRRLIAGLGDILDEEWPGSMLAWMLQCLLDAGYTRRTQLLNRAWQFLVAAQQPDGSFSVDEGDDPIQTTIQAIDVAQRLRETG